MVHAKLDINEGEVLAGEIETLFTNYEALRLREKIDKELGIEDFIQQLESKQPGLNIIKYEFENLENINKSIKSNFDVSIKNKVIENEDLLYLDPMLFYGLDNNPFKLKERDYPVNYLYPFSRNYVLQLEVPNDYTVEELPENSKISLPEKSASFSYAVSLENNQLQVTSKIKINKPIFVAGEYPALKEFYDLIIEKHDEQIVLRKKIK